MFYFNFQAHEENLKAKKDPWHFVTVPKVFKDYILKILEPITNHPANARIQKTLFFDNTTISTTASSITTITKPKFLG